LSKLQGRQRQQGQQGKGFQIFPPIFPVVSVVPAVPETPRRALRSKFVPFTEGQPIQNLALQYLGAFKGLTVSRTSDTIAGAALSALVGP